MIATAATRCRVVTAGSHVPTLGRGIRLVMGCVSVLCGGAVIAAELPLRAGRYVVVDESCADAPFASTATWDGRGLGGAHDADCTTRVRSRAGQTYRVATTCRALGDGTPTPPSTVAETIRIRSSTVFARVGPGGSQTYRRCGGLRP